MQWLELAVILIGLALLAGVLLWLTEWPGPPAAPPRWRPSLIQKC